MRGIGLEHAEAMVAVLGPADKSDQAVCMQPLQMLEVTPMPAISAGCMDVTTSARGGRKG